MVRLSKGRSFAKAASVRSRHRSSALLADIDIYFAPFRRVTSGEFNRAGPDGPHQGGRHVRRTRAGRSFSTETVSAPYDLGDRAFLLRARLRDLLRGSHRNQASRHD